MHRSDKPNEGSDAKRLKRVKEKANGIAVSLACKKIKQTINLLQQRTQTVIKRLMLH